MMLTYFSSVGQSHGAPRIWIEGERLARLGFHAGQRIDVTRTGLGLEITPSETSVRLVSRRRAAGSFRPILDLNSHALLAHLADYTDVRFRGHLNRLSVMPSIRAAMVLKQKTSRSTYRVIDVFAGGGSLSDAFADNPRFKVVAGVENEPTYADEFSRKHPDAEIIMGDFRKMQHEELPDFDVLVAGIPCTDHCPPGRSKNALSKKPELGHSGDLYIPVLALIAARMPAAIVLENTHLYGTSLAGQTVVSHLSRMGYSVASTILDPIRDYAEPTNRKRWVCVATIKPGFSISNPHSPFAGTIRQFLDAPDDNLDRADAARIAKTFSSLERHAARHNALRHGFGRSLKVLTGDEQYCPTILKSYSKINASGFFIATPHGPRMVRPEEVCRIHGQHFVSKHAKTVYELAGQGVLTRLFRNHIAAPLGLFLP